LKLFTDCGLIFGIKLCAFASGMSLYTRCAPFSVLMTNWSFCHC
jgi:hypothetical protein